MKEKSVQTKIRKGEDEKVDASELVPLHQRDGTKVLTESKAETKPSTTDSTSPANSTDTVIDADIAEFIPTPPDGGYGWVIVFASFMNHVILDGISYAFGAFMAHYQEYFESSAASTSALMSSLIGCYMLSAPIGSALINKFGCGPVGVAGSLLASLAFTICTFSNTIGVMTVLFGVCGGIGFGLMYMPAVISVSLYFEKKRPLAVGIGMCGTGVGTLVFGPTSKLLLDYMDWKGAHFILAGIILHGTLFSMLIRPLQTKHDRKVNLEKRLAKKNIILKNAQPNVVADDKLPLDQTTSTPGRSMMTSHPNMRTAGYNSRLNVGSINIYSSTGKLGSNKIVARLTTDEAQDLKRPLYRKDIFYSGSVYHLPEFKETSTVQEYVASITSIPAMHEKTAEPKTFRFGCFPRQMADALSEMLDFSLFKTLSFDLVAALNFVIMLAYLVPFAFTSVRAENYGVDPGKASLLISILGISTMTGRLLSSLLATFPNVPALRVHNISLSLAAASVIAMPSCTNFNTIAVAAFGYGFFMGGHVALSPIILVDLIGLDKLTTAYGILTLVRGISTLMGPPLAGKVYDYFGSYDIAFYVAGGIIFFCTMGFLLLELKCFKKQSCEDKSK